MPISNIRTEPRLENNNKLGPKHIGTETSPPPEKSGFPLVPLENNPKKGALANKHTHTHMHDLIRSGMHLCSGDYVPKHHAMVFSMRFFLDLEQLSRHFVAKKPWELDLVPTRRDIGHTLDPRRQKNTKERDPLPRPGRRPSLKALPITFGPFVKDHERPFQSFCLISHCTCQESANKSSAQGHCGLTFPIRKAKQVALHAHPRLASLNKQHILVVRFRPVEDMLLASTGRDHDLVPGRKVCKANGAVRRIPAVRVVERLATVK